MKLPCYPLVTIDPFFSIWSPSEKLYDSDTILWCGIKKRISGKITIDKITYRFMGLSEKPALTQTSLEVAPLVSTYVFENKQVRLTAEFFTPLFTDDLHLLSLPCSFIRTKTEALDGKEHETSVKIEIDKEFCYDRHAKPIEKKIQSGKASYAVMGRKKQKPLCKTGDGVSADWGYTCLYGDEPVVEKDGISASSNKEKATFIVAFDDVKSLEYMGVQYDGLWKEKFQDIDEAIAYCKENETALFEKAKQWNKKILDDADGFGESYKNLLTAAYRQILAAHKLVRNDNGDLLYFSKECHSNGCINTVDVSYPALPFFLIYNTDLVKAMMTGIFEFARTPLWTYDFAPHDIGQYPVANGQVYGLNKKGKLHKKELYKTKGDYYHFKYQMPVEECGNMLLMAYTHYLYSGDKSVIQKNYDLLSKWADYLKKVGVVLENQLCTDDFAGHSEKNVNLAIKSIMGLAAFSKISEALGKETDAMNTAKAYAIELSSYKLESGILPFAVGNTDTWSLKYNMVWDKVLGFGLFNKELYKAEVEHYNKKLNKYGVPLDHRKDFTKTDWMLWAAVLDETNESTDKFSEAIEKFLAETSQVVCFPDWIETKEAKYNYFNHRTVQAGLWFPVLWTSSTGMTQDKEI